jgi:hypothetical protein
MEEKKGGFQMLEDKRIVASEGRWPRIYNERP